MKKYNHQKLWQHKKKINDFQLLSRQPFEYSTSVPPGFKGVSLNLFFFFTKRSAQFLFSKLHILHTCGREQKKNHGSVLRLRLYPFRGAYFTMRFRSDSGVEKRGPWNKMCGWVYIRNKIFMADCGFPYTMKGDPGNSFLLRGEDGEAPSRGFVFHPCFIRLNMHFMWVRYVEGCLKINCLLSCIECIYKV